MDSEDNIIMAGLNASLALPSHKLIPVLASSQALVLQKKDLKTMSQVNPENSSVFYKAANATNYMQGVSDATIPVVHTLLNIKDDDLGDTEMFGVDLSSVLNFPQTKEDQAISIGLIQTSLANLETAATTASNTIQEIKHILVLAEEEKKLPKEEEEEPPGASKISKRPKGPLPKEKNEIVEKEKRKRLIWIPSGSPDDDGVLAEKRFDAIRAQEIDSSWSAMKRRFPDSVVDAVSMVLYLPKSTHDKSVLKYNVIKYLSKSGTPSMSSLNVPDTLPQTTNKKRAVVMRNLQSLASYTKEETLRSVLSERLSLLPILHVNMKSKTIDLEIPVAYVKSVVKGLSKWNNLFGYAAHFRIEVLRSRKGSTPTKRIVHQFASLELEHSEAQRKTSVKYKFTFPNMYIGDNIKLNIPTKPVSLFGNNETSVEWTKVTADVTRVYINSKEYSALYRKFQQEGLKARAKQTTLVRVSQMTYGEASDEKLSQLLRAIFAKGGGLSPVDFVTDYGIVTTKGI